MCLLGRMAMLMIAACVHDDLGLGMQLHSWYSFEHYSIFTRSAQRTGILDNIETQNSVKTMLSCSDAAAAVASVVAARRLATRSGKTLYTASWKAARRPGAESQ